MHNKNDGVTQAPSPPTHEEKTPDPTIPADLPPAGPHARRDLMNPELTPGTGALPPIDPDDDGNMQPTS